SFERNVTRYHELWAQHQGAGARTLQGTEPKIGLVTHMVLAETEAEALAIARPAWEEYVWNLETPYLDVACEVWVGREEAGLSATAFGLVFVPLQQVRYDIVVLKDYLHEALVEQLLNTLEKGCSMAYTDEFGTPQEVRTYTALRHILQNHCVLHRLSDSTVL